MTYPLRWRQLVTNDKSPQTTRRRGSPTHPDEIPWTLPATSLSSSTVGLSRTHPLWPDWILHRRPLLLRAAIRLRRGSILCDPTGTPRPGRPNDGPSNPNDGHRLPLRIEMAVLRKTVMQKIGHHYRSKNSEQSTDEWALFGSGFFTTLTLSSPLTAGKVDILPSVPCLIRWSGISPSK